MLTLIEQLRRLLIAGLSSQPSDVLSHAGVAMRMFQLLAAENINIQLSSTSEIKSSVVIAKKYAELAVRVLHDGFGLSRPPAERAGI